MLNQGNMLTRSADLRGEVPQAEGSVPGSWESKLAIWGDDNITHEVRVTPQGALGDAVVGLITGQFPHDDRLVWETEETLDSSHMGFYLNTLTRLKS